MVALKTKKGMWKTRTLDIKKLLLEINKDNSLGHREGFCCDKLMEYINLENSPFIYLPPTRSYLIISNNITIDIEYCPCCGEKLPEDLTNELMIVLDKLGFSYEDPNLPQEFKSDQWSKLLGL